LMAKADIDRSDGTGAKLSRSADRSSLGAHPSFSGFVARDKIVSTTRNLLLAAAAVRAVAALEAYFKLVVREGFARLVSEDPAQSSSAKVPWERLRSWPVTTKVVPKTLDPFVEVPDGDLTKWVHSKIEEHAQDASDKLQTLAPSAISESWKGVLGDARVDVFEGVEAKSQWHMVLYNGDISCTADVRIHPDRPKQAIFEKLLNLIYGVRCVLVHGDAERTLERTLSFDDFSPGDFEQVLRLREPWQDPASFCAATQLNRLRTKVTEHGMLAMLTLAEAKYIINIADFIMKEADAAIGLLLKNAHPDKVAPWTCAEALPELTAATLFRSSDSDSD
jgi:hypothetical protein